MSEVKPDCYCLGGDKAHYSEAKYQSLQRTYEQARDEAKHLYGECLMLADVLRDAFEVVKTIEGEDSDECDKLQDLRISIEYALAAYDERRIETANVEVTGLAAASLPQGPCGLPGSAAAGPEKGEQR